MKGESKGEQHATGQNLTCSRTEPLYMGPTVYQLSYPGPPVNIFLVYTMMSYTTQAKQESANNILIPNN